MSENKVLTACLYSPFGNFSVELPSLTEEQLAKMRIVTRSMQQSFSQDLKGFLAGCIHSSLEWVNSLSEEDLAKIAAEAEPQTSTEIPVIAGAKNLTKREVQIMLLLASGKTNRVIANELKISAKTVDTHRGHILKKLGLLSNSDLARFAIKHGYISL